jgi:IS30 family transposase
MRPLTEEKRCTIARRLPSESARKDNRTEFYKHRRIAKMLHTDFYFAHPYSSWERGLNEYTNGLIRQYFPKKNL